MSGTRPDVNDPLMLAARYNDADAEDHGTIQAVIERLGMDFDEVVYVAEQRALRLVLLRRGRLDELSRTEFQRLPMTEFERAEVEALTTLYLDGIALGWRAQMIERKDKDDEAPASGGDAADA